MYCCNAIILLLCDIGGYLATWYRQFNLAMHVRDNFAFAVTSDVQPDFLIDSYLFSIDDRARISALWQIEI